MYRRVIVLFLTLMLVFSLCIQAPIFAAPAENLFSRTNCSSAYSLTDTLSDGDTVIIFLPNSEEAVNSEMTISPFSIVDNASSVDPAFLWTVEIIGDYYVFTKDNKALSCYAEEETVYNDPFGINPTLDAISHIFISTSIITPNDYHPTSTSLWLVDRLGTSSQFYLHTTIGCDVIDDYVETIAEIKPVEFYKCTHINATLSAAVPASCTSVGNCSYYYCQDCQKYFSDSTLSTEISLADVTIDVTGHTYVGGFCKYCGTKESPTFTQTSSLKEDNKVIIYLPETRKAVNVEDTFSQFSIDDISTQIDSTFLWTVETDNERFMFSNGNHTLCCYAENETVWMPMPVYMPVAHVFVFDGVHYPDSGDEFGRGDIESFWSIDRIGTSLQYYLHAPVWCPAADFEKVPQSIKSTSVDTTTAEIGPVEFYKQVDTSDLKIDSVSAILYHNIAMNFVAFVPEGMTDPYLVIEVGEQSYTLLPTREDSQGRAIFEYMNLKPNQMGDNIKTTLYATCNGNLYEYCKPEYSVRQYCTNLMTAHQDDAKLKTLLADMLIYGATAQIYSGYNTDNLVTSGLNLTPSAFSTLTGKTVSFEGTADAATDWLGAGLLLGNNVDMRFSFFTDNLEGLSVAVSVNGREEMFTTEDFTTDGTGKYHFEFSGIEANEFDDVVNATFYRGGKSIGRTVSYSVNTYVCSMQNCENANLKALVRALYNYGASAKAYLSAE